MSAGTRHHAVLVGEDDGRAIQETLHRSQVPGFVASVREGMATPHEEMSEDLDTTNSAAYLGEQVVRRLSMGPDHGITT